VRATRRQWAAALGALALLNFGLTFESVWPTPWIRPHAALSVELAAAVLALAFAAARIGPLPRRWLAGLAAGFTVLALGRYVEVTARELYGRPINLYYDGPHVPRVLAMFVEAAPLWLSAAVVAGVAIGIAALYALARWAWTRVGTVFAVPGARRTVALAAAGVCAAYPLAGNWFTPPVSASYVRQGVLLAQTSPAACRPSGAPTSSSCFSSRTAPRPTTGPRSLTGSRRTARPSSRRPPRAGGPSRRHSSNRRPSAAHPGSRTRACCPAWTCATAMRTTC
jgi:hypothetical protein